MGIDAVGIDWSVVLVVGGVEFVGRARVPCNEHRKLRRAIEKVVERILLGFSVGLLAEYLIPNKILVCVA